ncbi:methyl-accepting chemotaxis protein [Pelomonas sp. SE-A7]|uniref:methyl-accepting chemotaxis protein n=1 Tax=Pelomonas sp. SE-A7 TaxID=3054953 RepID=UPI00259D3044|nr:methyl-accepting chemotaxis protein [Pelomonas sp. SE-A7]MDM4764474.1 methyl-accepting chemotaxis protein [Pelomonas sp. SE-A7]
MSLSALIRQFSIRTRMIGAIAMVLGLLLVVGAVGLTGMNSLRTQTKQFAEMSVAEANNMSRLIAAMGDLRRYEKDMIINMASADEVRSHRKRWDEARQVLATASKEMLKGEEDADNKVLRQMLPLIDSYADKALPVFGKLESGGYTDVAVANKEMSAAKDSIKAAEKLLEELRDALSKESLSAQAQAEGTQSRVLTWFVVVLVLSAVVVAPLTLLNMKSICDPLAEAEALAEAIAEGDLTSQIKNIEGKDEATHLMKSLEKMQQALQSLIGQLRTAADSIRTASVEIATGNTDLSGRTEQTASNLQQAASSMEQLTGTVKQTADSARTANQLASSASQAAARGGEVVGHVVTTMEDINTSSKKISDIIGVIDGIAFQTNILALNAAVEAARAGEQGRGFAVVAGEVRSLAQRSAEAAKEIKTLIGASVERVETGSRLVQEAGNSMSEIVAGVQRVTDIIGEISAAASEQSDGIATVNQSVVQLDQMTQQNAALVEESAAAAESLRDQAERLAHSVDRFRISGTAPARTASAPQPASAHKAAVARPAAPVASKMVKPVAGKPAPAKAAGAPAVRPSPAPKFTAPPPAPTPARAPAPAADGDWETF